MGVSMTRVGRRRANARLDGRGEAHTTSRDTTTDEHAGSGDPPSIGITAGGTAEHGAATCSSCETLHGEGASCVPGSGVPATGRYR